MGDQGVAVLAGELPLVDERDEEAAGLELRQIAGRDLEQTGEGDDLLGRRGLAWGA